MNKKELYQIIIGLIIVIFVATFRSIADQNDLEMIFYLALSAVLVLAINIFAKKFTSHYFETQINHKIWMWQRFGFRREQKLDKPWPMGIILPFLVTILSIGNLFLFTVFEFDIKTTTARVSKRHQWFKYTEITDFHLGLIAASGVIANLLFALIGYILDLPEFARLNIFFALSCMIPFGNLDGTKIFFANKGIWTGLGIITLIFFTVSLII